MSCIRSLRSVPGICIITAALCWCCVHMGLIQRLGQIASIGLWHARLWRDTMHRNWGRKNGSGSWMSCFTPAADVYMHKHWITTCTWQGMHLTQLLCPNTFLKNPNANVQLVALPALLRSASHPATGPLPQGRCAQPLEEPAEQLHTGLCISHMTCSSATAVESAGWSSQQWPVRTKPAWHSSSQKTASWYQGLLHSAKHASRTAVPCNSNSIWNLPCSTLYSMKQNSVLALNTTTIYFRYNSDRSINTHLIAESPSMYRCCQHRLCSLTWIAASYTLTACTCGWTT